MRQHAERKCDDQREQRDREHLQAPSAASTMQDHAAKVPAQRRSRGRGTHRRQLAALGALGPQVGMRWMLYGAYRDMREAHKQRAP